MSYHNLNLQLRDGRRLVMGNQRPGILDCAGNQRFRRHLSALQQREGWVYPEVRRGAARRLSAGGKTRRRRRPNRRDIKSGSPAETHSAGLSLIHRGLPRGSGR